MLSLNGEQDGGGIGIISLQSTRSEMSSQHLAEMLANSRKEAIRKQHIGAEQRWQDELREGYARLKDILPLSNQKSSKVSLLKQGMYSHTICHKWFLCYLTRKYRTQKELED